MRKKIAIRLGLLIIILFCIVVEVIIDTFAGNIQSMTLMGIYYGSGIIWGIILMILGGIVFTEHHFENGFWYFLQHWIITNRLERQMIDAGFCIQRGKIIDIPKIKLSLSKDLSTGCLYIRNALKFDNKLDKATMSSALGRYIVDYHYLTDDGNYYVYELIEGSTSFKLTFNSFTEFLKHNYTIQQYELFLDNRSIVKLQSCLLVGITGSGKSYGLYNFVIQMLNKIVPYKIFFADPKGSSLEIIGTAVAEERTAADIQPIIRLLEEFVGLMQERKKELRHCLSNKIDADYSDFGLSPMVFICDEYASFASVLAAEDKATRDKVKGLLYQIILQGRQLGCFLFLVMQKSDATLIDTALRDNVPLKIVLGNSEQQTYVTTFGAGITIPNRHYVIGEGVFTEPEIAPEPKLVQLPQFNFDILKAIKAPEV